MARAGQIIENPVTGERITFLKTSAETGGELLSVEVELPPRAKGVPEHYHLDQTECFEVLEGSLGIHAGGRDLRLRPGETAEVPPRMVHRFWNSSDVTVRFRSEITPPLRIETMLEAAHGLARDGKVSRNGVPKNIFQLALLFELSQSCMVFPPLPVQRAVFGNLARAARLLGYSDEFPDYTGVSVADRNGAVPSSPGSVSSTPGLPGPTRYPGTPTSSGPGELLPWVSTLYLVAAVSGAAVAIRENLPGEFAGRTSGRTASADFLSGLGTALSPPLGMLVAQVALSALSTHGGRAGKVGVAGLTALGAGATIGMLGEPVAYRVLSPKTFDPAKAVLVSALIALPSLMTILGAKRLLATGSQH